MINEQTIYSYKNGFSEGVVFAFYQEGKILIEHRPNESIIDSEQETFFTNGSIEIKDHLKSEDYVITALKREINEEFNGKIIPKDFNFLGILEVPEINVLFYVYLISKWEGIMPNYTIEEGKKFADLEWINLSEKLKYFKYNSAFEICKMIEEYIIQTPLDN